MSITKAFEGKVTDANGLFATLAGTMTILTAPSIGSISVSPQSAVAGTVRTITFNGVTGDAPLTYSLTIDGVPTTMTPTAQTNVFTVTV